MNIKKESNDTVEDIKDLAFYKNENVQQAKQLVVVSKEVAVEKEEKAKLEAALVRSARIENTERKKGEETIAHLAAIVEYSEDAIISKSMDGIIKSWNRGSEKMFGYSASEAIGKHISLIIPPNFVEEEQKIIERICNNERIDNYETVRSRKGGEEFYVSLTVSPLKNRAGIIIGVSKIARDITIRKKAEAALTLANRELVYQNGEKEKRAAEFIIANKELTFQNEEKERRASELIIANKELAFQNKEKERRASELIIANEELAFQNEEKGKRAAELTLANNELSFQNKEKENRASELIIANKELAFQNEEKEKRAAELVVANEELAFQNEEKGKRAAELTLANNELSFQNNEKEKRASELIIANKELAFQNEEKEKRAAELIVANKELAFQNDEKEKRAAELTLANIELAFQNKEKHKRSEELSLANSDLKIIEKQLKETNRELEAFSYSVSHDLRAPLRAIDGFSTILKEDFQSKLDVEGNRVIDVIIENAQMMSELIDNLLSFSKMARLEVISNAIDMNKLVEKCVAHIVPVELLNKYDIHIHEIPSCNGDAAMLKQVWFNLVSNAVKYSSKKDNPVIEVGTVQDQNSVIYFVKDNGAGFEMKYSRKLFGVFQRLHRQDEFEGTGLGLALAKRIIKKHGGKIWVNSVLNEGSVFYFSIPKTFNNE